MKFTQVEETKQHSEGEYLMKIYEVNQKTSQAGNPYFQIKFESQEGLRVCDNFMFHGKAANKTLVLLSALGQYDGNGWENLEINQNNLLGHYLYVDLVKDGDFLRPTFAGFRNYENKSAQSIQSQKNECPF